MGRLEAEFGLALLERTPRGVAPTAAGQRLLAHAQTVLLDCQALHAGMAQQRASAAGQLRVGVLPMLTHTLLAPLIARFLPTRPMARFRFDSQLSAPLLDRLASGELDLAFLALPDTLPKGMAQQRLGPLTMCMVARADHPRLDRFRRLADLADERWALPTADLFLRQWLDERLRVHGLPEALVVVESNASPGSFAGLLRHSDLLGLSAASMLRRGMGEGLQALQGPDFHWQHELGVVWRTSGLSPLAREFRDEAIAWCADRVF
jgi:DNA-binding transcriptional LysR family regulator